MGLPVTDATIGQSLPDAVNWVTALLFGSIGTTIAILAVAAIGLLMLSGRVPVRRGVSVIIGCFILFSASIVAQALITGAGGGTILAAVPPPLPAYVPSVPNPGPYDPYAGASVHVQGQRDLLR